MVRRLGKFFITSAQSTSYVFVIDTDRLRRGSVFRVNMDCLRRMSVQEPAWLKARRIKKAYVQDHVSHRLLGMLEEEAPEEVLLAVQTPAAMPE